MDNVLILPTAADDIETLAANMRPADVREVFASSGRDPLTVVRRSVAVSTYCYSAFYRGELACIFGLAPYEDDTGAPWSLGTKLQDLHLREFVRHAPGYVADMLSIFPRLFNFVDARNTRSIRWLQRIGFTIHPAQPYGAHGLPFHPFEMRSGYV